MARSSRPLLFMEQDERQKFHLIVADIPDSVPIPVFTKHGVANLHGVFRFVVFDHNRLSFGDDIDLEFVDVLVESDAAARRHRIKGE